MEEAERKVLLDDRSEGGRLKLWVVDRVAQIAARQQQGLLARAADRQGSLQERVFLVGAGRAALLEHEVNAQKAQTLVSLCDFLQ